MTTARASLGRCPGVLVQRCVVGTYHQQVGFTTLVQLGEAGMVVAHLLSIECEQRLHPFEVGGHGGAPVYRAGVVEGVAAMQDPSTARINGYTCVPSRVPGQ